MYKRQVFTPDQEKKLPPKKYLTPVKTLEKFEATKKYILPSEDEVTGGGRCHLAVVINNGNINALPKELRVAARDLDEQLNLLRKLYADALPNSTKFKEYKAMLLNDLNKYLRSSFSSS